MNITDFRSYRNNIDSGSAAGNYFTVNNSAFKSGMNRNKNRLILSGKKLFVLTYKEILKKAFCKQETIQGYFPDTVTAPSVSIARIFSFSTM